MMRTSTYLANSPAKQIFFPVLLPSVLLATAAASTTAIQILALMELGASESLAALVVAASAVAALVLTVPIGRFIEKVGEAKTAKISMALSALNFLLLSPIMAFPGKYSIAFFFAVTIFGVAPSMAWGIARQSTVAQILKPLQRGRGLTALGGAERVGSLLGPLLTAALLLFLPMWAVFLVAGFIGLSTLILYLNLDSVKQIDQEAKDLKQAQSREEISTAVDWKVVFVAGISTIILAVARRCQIIIVPLWGVRIGLNPSQIALVMAISSAVDIFFMLSGGYLKDSIGRSKTLMLCLFLLGAGVIGMTFTNNLWWLLVAVAISAVGNGFGAGINMTIGSDLSPEIGRAKFLSKWVMFSIVGTLGGPTLVSMMLLYTSLPATVMALGSLSIFGSIWAIMTQPITKLPEGTRNSR